MIGGDYLNKSLYLHFKCGTGTVLNFLEMSRFTVSTVISQYNFLLPHSMWTGWSDNNGLS